MWVLGAGHTAPSFKLALDIIGSLFGFRAGGFSLVNHVAVCPFTELWVLLSTCTWVWLCMFVGNNLSWLVSAGQTFSTMGAYKVAWLVWLTPFIICFFWYWTYLKTFRPFVLTLKAIYRKVWNSFWLFLSLLIRTGSWLCTPVGPLWVRSWFPGQLLLASTSQIYNPNQVTVLISQLPEWSSWLLHKLHEFGPSLHA